MGSYTAMLASEQPITRRTFSCRDEKTQGVFVCSDRKQKKDRSTSTGLLVHDDSLELKIQR